MSELHNDYGPADRPEQNQTTSRNTMIDADSQHSQQQRNRDARQRACAAVSPAINLAAPGVEFSSEGRLLVIGPEHRIRLAVAKLQCDQQAPMRSITALVTEAMPQQIDDEMERAAELVPELELLRLSLKSIGGYLGRFEVLVEVDGCARNLALLALNDRKIEHFDLVLDLASESTLAAELKPAGYFHPQTDNDYQDALAQLPLLNGSFDKPRYFQVDPERCALSGSNLDGCRRCLDVCAADAISIGNDGKGPRVQIDAHLCHGAGACSTVCPTSAIRYGFPQPQLVLDSLQRLVRSYYQQGGVMPHLLIHDAALADANTGSENNSEGEAGLDALLAQLPGHYLPLQLEEVGSGGLELWLSAIALGSVGVAILADESLPGVSLPETTRAALDGEIDTANRLLSGLDLGAQVRLLDRTRLQQLARHEHPQQALCEGFEPIDALDINADKRRQISLAMSHLYQQQIDATELSPVVKLAAGAPFGSVDVAADDCTLCMSCVSICPAKALSSSSDTPRLSFTEDDCVQCGLCVQACPEQVLSLQPRYLLQPHARTHERVLKEEQPFCCIRCEKPFATQSVVSLMIKKLAGHSMFDSAGLKRLEMCEDCRVIDIVQNDPGGDLFEYAKGREQHSDELNLAVVEQQPPQTQATKTQANSSDNKIDAVEVQQ